MHAINATIFLMLFRIFCLSIPITILEVPKVVSPPSLRKLPRILIETSQGANNSVVRMLRLYPSKMAPTSLSNTKKLFHNIHMQWMCIWMSPYQVTASLVKQAFGSCLQSRIIGTSWGANNSILLLLRLKILPRWIPLHCHTHIQCFTTFICCGWAHGWVIIMLLLVLSAKPLELPRILGPPEGQPRG